VGRPVRRREDPRFLAGEATYIDDLKMAGMLHVAMLRSPHAHARILRLDGAAAAAMPGVHVVFTGEDAQRLSSPLKPIIPIPIEPQAYCLATDRVRYAGEAVAAVAAETRALAEDALDRIAVTYEPLPPVMDPEAALRPDAPLLYPDLGHNVIWHDAFVYGDVDGAFAAADLVVRERFSIHRYSSTPLETFGVVAQADRGTGVVTIWSNDGRPGLNSGTVAGALGIAQGQLRLIAPDVGGGFGNKRRAAYLILCALLSRATGRPVKFVEDRREHLLALMHAANGVMDLEAAVRRDGTLLALRARDVVDEGNNLINPTLHSLLKLGNIANVYGVRAVAFEGFCVLTTKCPSGANRGIGKPFMCFAVERLMDRVAERLGLDRVALRRHNLIPSSAFPYETPTGALYDSGDFGKTLDQALALSRYDDLCRERDAARRAGRFLGVGLAMAVEPGTSNLSSYMLTTGRRVTSGAGEAAMVRVEQDGRVRVATGNVGSGQSYETVIPQIVADELGVPPEAVTAATGFDSFSHPWMFASGNYSNKFSGMDVGAIVGAARTVRDKVLAIAAHVLETPVETLTLADGRVMVRGDAARSLTLAQVAEVAYKNLVALPEGSEPGLEARHYYLSPVATVPDAQRRLRAQLIFTNSVHVCQVEVDPETGGVRILKYVVAHDCGTEINPMVVEGLVHGSTLHGIGGTLLEEFVYAEDGQLLTTSFMDYLKPGAMDAPDIEVGHLETPSPFTVLGAKGVGEGGSIPAAACLASAVEDALAPLGVRITTLPLTPRRIWEMVEEARQGAGA
jgi:2-furoyl-CoA dehydrogenase large subunit